ncbi:hypothetical protein SAMD00019534_029170 [Acytostelium subglobosum LB1]|uniref:hypothetical protein n=1 Tax=Acytostelium subglobosum LB1 TaxID=1410327 RepID=UPI0006450BC8|nr:hypothetical protein SAMD00019534_029170 [Acytostelium subglobosum LB1]GAM19742.1 hypothetical protein SAMD00019534_029170 [Acytostelium subglobosum LB1]|eukprot:XP_012756504.1 hypothetical protein SAMD00019534_029170 [Acytostelium subglobosum LB1]
MEHRHRAGPLKQSNKTFKAGKHDSKGQIKRRAAGKIEQNTPRQGVKSGAVVKSRSAEIRQKQLKMTQSKRAEALERARLGLPDVAAPRIISVIPLSENVDIKLIKSQMLKKFELSGAELESSHTTVSLTSKVRATFICIDSRDIETLIHSVKLADIILFVVNPAEFEVGGIAGGDTKFDEKAERLCSVIKAQGVPSSMLLMQHFDKIAQKKKNDVKKQLTSLFHFQFPDEPKVLPADDDMGQVLRFVEAMHINEPVWKQARPYIMVEGAENDAAGNLVLTGFVRGNSLSAKQIMHLPELGDFQIEKIEQAADPHQTRHKKAKDEQSAMQDSTAKILDKAEPEERDTLQTHNIPDLNEQEQTMPTNEEIELAQANRKKKVLVPKGTSSYQASWYLDDEEEPEEDYEDEDGEDAEMGEQDDQMDEQDGEEQDGEDEEEELEELELNSDKWIGKSKEDIEKIKKAEEEDAEEDMKDEDEDEDDESDDEDDRGKEKNELEFPDEANTPTNIPCRVRFSKYRGLKSFRSSPWDAYENLPLDYARIFQFHSFNQSMRASSALQDKAPVKPDQYVRITLAGGPSAAQVIEGRNTPLVASGLMRYENKISVLHFQCEKHRHYDEPVKSKEEVYFHVGFRHFSANPIYSISAPNCDKQKYEKFLFAGRNTVATVYAPVMFPPAPLLVFRDRSCAQLVATGHLASVNPDRIICKRIILTGYIAKALSRKFVTVRDMFYFPEDIEWFKKIELHTKMGRVGHIKESLGTHGRMKCLFDGKMNQQDTVCLNPLQACLSQVGTAAVTRGAGCGRRV